MATTKWTCNVDDGGNARLMCQMTEDAGQPSPPTPMAVKGLCYSPAPINGSNQFAPAIGDWYWDDFQVNGTTIRGWKPLWDRDFGPIRQLGGNAVRVYCMLSRQLNVDYSHKPPLASFPEPWNSGHLFTHTSFLDACFNAQPRLYALVGIPVPATMLWKVQYDQAPPAEKDYWMNVLTETAQSVAGHPGVMGFTIQNEQDGADVCYNNPEWAAFWWGQVETMAAAVKRVAPDKIVGMATHDDPNIPRMAAAYMAQCPSVDFWGVNTYQTQNLSTVFDDYAALAPPARKAVLLTEYGMPATSRRDPGTAGSIYDDAATRQKASAVVATVVPQAYQHPLCIGLYYFEFCDEWWNQPEAPNIWTWWGGPPAAGLPNGYWDNDGFGLYSSARGGGVPNDADIWDAGANGPALPIDVHTERTELTSALANAFRTP